jgi:hypothetical protein
LAGSYGGRICEVVDKRLITLQMISRSFAYVAIIAIVGVAMFVVIMDVLKYCFDIDPVDRKCRTTKSKKKKKPIQIIRFRYIHAEVQKPSRSRNDIIKDTII